MDELLTLSDDKRIKLDNDNNSVTLILLLNWTESTLKWLQLNNDTIAFCWKKKKQLKPA